MTSVDTLAVGVGAPLAPMGTKIQVRLGWKLGCIHEVLLWLERTIAMNST